jgi:hypothetical protein
VTSSSLRRTPAQDLSTTNLFTPAYARKETTRARDISGYIGIYRDISGYIGIYRDISGYIGIYRDIDDVLGDSHDINLPASEVRAV